MVKRIKRALILSVLLILASVTAFADGAIPDHTGTDMSNVAVGTGSVNSAVRKYFELFKSAGDRFGVDPNLLAAICMQESSGRNLSYREDGTEYPAWGIMQIEKSNEKSFAAFGKNLTGTEWTLADRLVPEKAIQYAAYLISRALIHYDCDYMKTIQSYNFGQTVLDRIIEAKGTDWLSERANAKAYADNWSYDSYGDAEYIEHVMRYYKNEIAYIGAKVRVDGELVDFDDQYPIIEDGRTLIPIRATAEILSAKVSWNDTERQAEITKDGMSIILPAESSIAYVNNSETELDVPAKIVNDRIMVPLRFIAESFDISVDWEQGTRTVYITSKRRTPLR